MVEFGSEGDASDENSIADLDDIDLLRLSAWMVVLAIGDAVAADGCL